MATSPDNQPAVRVQDLQKSFKTAERPAGLGAALRSLIRPTYKTVAAVSGVSFSVAPGEMVGFLGPNGAGKTTTLKMLSGLLHPSGGEARVLGYEPFQRQREFLRAITLVMGQRSQLEWDIPAADSFDVNRAVYRVPSDQFKATLGELTELLELDKLINKPVRTLSLGERMKCELAAALLHRPKVLFLDEPTIGLDVTMQRRIRTFLAEYNKRHGATVLLTSHYMADVEALCKRVVVIHHGRILYDGELSGLTEKFAPHKTIRVEYTGTPPADWSTYGETQAQSEGTVTLRVAKEQTAALTARLLKDFVVRDLTVEDPPIEDVIERVFAEKPSA